LNVRVSAGSVYNLQLFEVGFLSC